MIDNPQKIFPKIYNPNGRKSQFKRGFSIKEPKESKETTLQEVEMIAE